MNQTLGRRAALVLLSTAAPVALLAAPAQAAPSLSASRTTGIDPAGETVTVRGSGYDPDSGIYVTVCVDNGEGAQPTPCLGGIPKDGEETPYSAWYSNDPQWEGVATTWDGSFTVALRVQAVSGKTDCRTAPRGCVLVTRGDHTQGWSRQIKRIPLAFAGAAPVMTAPAAPATRAPSGAAAVPATRAPGAAPVATTPSQTRGTRGPGAAATPAAPSSASPGASGTPSTGAPSTSATAAAGATTQAAASPGAAADTEPTTAPTTAPTTEPRTDALAGTGGPSGGPGGGTGLLLGGLAVAVLVGGGGAWVLRARRGGAA